MDITHDNVCSSMLSCFYSHLLSTGRPISSFNIIVIWMGRLVQKVFILFLIHWLYVSLAMIVAPCTLAYGRTQIKHFE